MNYSKKIIKEAKSKNKTIVFPEAEISERTISAIKKIVKTNMCKCILIGNYNNFVKKDKCILKNCEIIDPKTNKLKNKVAKYILEKRKEKGLTEKEAKNLASDPHYFATALVGLGIADGMVGGAEVSTAKNLKPALQLIKGKTGFVGSYFIFIGKNKATDNVFFVTDCALNENPTSEQLATLGQMIVNEAKTFLPNEAKVAFLSYSTHGSAKSEMVEKVQKAYMQFSENNKEVQAIGEVQIDAALFERVRKVKMPNCNFEGSANIFVMPDINAGNICYKSIQYFGGLKAIGPIIMGLNKPINDLSRGCSVQDIVELTAITVLQCE